MSVQSTEPISSPESFDGKSRLFDQVTSLMAMQEQHQKQVEEHFREVRVRLESMEELMNVVRQDGRETCNGAETDWEAKKRAVYEEHGMVVEGTTKTQEEHPAKPSITRCDDSVADGKDNMVGNDLDSMKVSDADRNEIERLKEELHEKLRLAEMELSISRAKIAQETAQLEDQRHELEKLSSHVVPQTPGTKEGKKSSMLDRLSRHMIPSRKSDQD